MIALLFALSLAAQPSPTTSTAPSAAPSPTPIATPHVAPADGTYEYEFRSGAATIGTSSIAIQHKAGSIDVHEIAALAGRSVTMDEKIDPVTLTPTDVDAQYPGATGPVKIHVSFVNGVGTETVSTMTGTKTLTPPLGSKGVLPLDGPLMCGFFLMAAQADALGTSDLNAVSPGGAVTFAMTLQAADAATRPKGVPATDKGYAASGLPSGSVIVWFDPVSFVAHEFDIPSQGIAIVLAKQTSQINPQATAPPAATPLPLPSPHYVSRDIVFTSSDGTRLAGTLTVPIGQTRPLPAIVLVHGSGPIDRNEQIGPNPIFLELANALSNYGYVVLRYDKRGVGKSGGDYATHTRNDLLADATAGIDWVAKQPGVDRKSVFIIGHSEGGELAPSLAASIPWVRGIALMAPPALPLSKILVQQATRGLNGDALAKARTKEEAAIFGIRAGLVNAPGTAWLRTSLDIDPVNLIKRVPCPILILQGTKDIQVLAADLPRLVNAAKAAHRDVTVHVFPNGDHLFNRLADNQLSDPAEYMVPTHVDPAVISTLIGWLSARAKR